MAAVSQMFLPLDPHGASFGAQPLAFAFGAGGVAAIFAQHDADMQLVFLALQQREEAVHAEELCLPPSRMNPADRAGRSYQGTSVGMPCSFASASVR